MRWCWTGRPFTRRGAASRRPRGTLDGVTVTDTQERGEEILHLTDQPLEVGTTVTGQLDWAHRFSLMQNHSGEHIVSGIIHRRTGGNNVGFHMGSDTITVDLDVELTAEELAEIEAEANRVVWANGATQIFHPTAEELKDLDYRSKKELTGDVRIVTFPGADTCACCGTHVTRTGEIGLIKLISVQKFKEGSRIEMLCGDRALAYINGILEQNHQISVGPVRQTHENRLGGGAAQGGKGPAGVSAEQYGAGGLPAEGGGPDWSRRCGAL